MRRVALATVVLLACNKPTAAPGPAAPNPDAPQSAAVGPPQSRTVEVANNYHGVRVFDPYQWLEDWDSDEVKAWSDAQNDYARKHLDALEIAKVLRPEIESVLAAPVVSYSSVVRAGGVFFASKRQPPKPQPVVVLLKSVDDLQGARVLIDPSTLDEEGSTSVDWFRPSPDGSLLAASLSAGGSESGDVHIFDVATGEQVHEVIPRVNGGTAGGDLSWTKDGKGFFYTRYPADGERDAKDMAFYQQLWFHELGTPVAEDRYELGKDLPRIAEIQLDRNPASDALLVTVQKGDG
ncbi:MAG: S9 family peptidase, partial [Myxococcota bacterium]